jgi:hypothetical protein
MSQLILPRRTFLKGLGVTLALPYLEAMWPARGFAAQSAAIPRRLAFVFFPNGAIMQHWTPKAEGTDFDLPATLAPLEKVRAKINVLSGLMQDNANAKGDGPGDHARSAAAFLTGAHPNKQGEIRVGISADQVAAEKVGRSTRLPSLELGTEPNRTAGQCDSGYSCAYSSAISWKTPTTPMAKEIVPRLAFERMFGGSGEDRKLAEKRNFFRKSILDVVSEDAAKLQQKLGRSDRQKLDQYFTSVREIEQRIARAQADAEQRPVPDVQLPPGVPRETDEHISLMFDLLAIAFQTDTTRVATYMLANEGSDRKYQMIGLEEGHHSLSHHQNKEDMMAKIQKIDRYLVGKFAAFLEKLDSIPEGDGTLLDHSMIVYGSAIGDGNAHNHDNLPVVLAGRGGGTIQTGRHIVYNRTPMNNLFLSLLDRMEAGTDQLGDSNGRLERLQD